MNTKMTCSRSLLCSNEYNSVGTGYIKGIKILPLLQYVSNNGFCLVLKCTIVRLSNQYKPGYLEHDIAIEPSCDCV